MTRALFILIASTATALAGPPAVTSGRCDGGCACSKLPPAVASAKLAVPYTDATPRAITVAGVPHYLGADGEYYPTSRMPGRVDAASTPGFPNPQSYTAPFSSGCYVDPRTGRQVCPNQRSR